MKAITPYEAVVVDRQGEGVSNIEGCISIRHARQRRDELAAASPVPHMVFVRRWNKAGTKFVVLHSETAYQGKTAAQRRATS